MRAAEAVIAVIAAGLAAAPAEARTATFDIPAGRLGDSLLTLAAQAGISIGSDDQALAKVQSRAVRGRMSLRSALDRLLAGTGYTYRFVGPQAVRVVRAPAPPRNREAERQRPPPPAPQPETIIVTGSKQGTSLQRFGGTVRLIDLTPEDTARIGALGSEAIVDRLPMLASTSLGPGRNKLYIRGVADSSFNGPSQSVVGEYLGDVRLTFNAPDPDLRLYDIGRVEILEGPQGTLYGSGALGGILRLVPNAPDPSGFSASVSGGVSATQQGQAGGDLAAMVNLPIAGNRAALRAVAYASVAGGYIDDVGRGLADVNRTEVHGGRVALRWDAGNDWQVEAGGLAQYIAVNDAQYALLGLPPLTRSSALAQPFDNDYLLGHLTVRKRWPGMEMVSTTGVVRHVLESDFDATGYPGTSGPQLYVEDVGITLLTHETRLSRPSAHGPGWVIGWSLVDDINRISRRLGPPGATVPIAGVRNEIREAALFGQYSHALDPRLTATLGGRVTYSEALGAPLDAGEDIHEPKRRDFRFSPSAAITWQPAESLLVFARYQNGFRAGGLAVSGTPDALTVRRYRSDRLSSVEVGARFRPAGDRRLLVNASLSYASWANIQADLIDLRGLPFTTNLGTGRIYGFEAQATWQATPWLRYELAGFLNDSALSRPAPAFATAQDRDLPNIARSGARAAVNFKTALPGSRTLTVDGSLRYVGSSNLGIGPPFEVEQGDYIEGELGARIDFGRFGLSLNATNIGNVRGNRFSFGNPFTLAAGRQVTPLNPRTIRIGFDAEF